MLKEINEEFSKIDEKNKYKINSDDEKLKIEHEKSEDDYTKPLTEKEREIDSLKNKMADKKIELHRIEKDIGTAIKKLEIIKLKLENRKQ